MKKCLYLVFLVLLVSTLVVGCTEPNNGKNSSQVISSQSTENQYKDEEWTKNVSEFTEVLKSDTDDVSKAIENSDWYTTFENLEKYKLDLDNAIKSSDSFTVSPELQKCKDEYKLGLIDDYNAAVLIKTSISLLTSGDLSSSTETSDEVIENFKSANSHYDNVTSLIDSYNENHKSVPLNLSTQYHNVNQEDNQSTVDTSGQTEPKTKTLADKDQEDTEGHISEDDVDDADTSESTAYADSSTQTIFDYCTWQAETTKNIGEYYKAPDNKIYVIITLNINNTGDQIYSTNGNYWHLKIGDMYYQYDSSTYDSSLNHMTADIGPGGKITTKITYLVDGDPLISDMELYYDGPGSDGIIYS